MSRRRKKQGASMYLNPDLDAINESSGQTFISCTHCTGFGPPLGHCRACGRKLPNVKVSTMPIKLTEEIKGHKSGGGNHTGGTTGGGYFMGGQQQQTWHNTCNHNGDKLVFESEGKQLFGAKGFNLDEFSGKWGLIIDLAAQVRFGTSFVKAVTTPTKKYDALKKYCLGQKAVASEVLALDWNDGSAPPVTLDFWLHLWSMLPAKTVACCIGGHGRTGTCLTALMIASGVDYYSALETTHSEHCTKAVETLNQETYLHRMYKERLERELAEAYTANSKDVKDIEADIDYANSHVPTSACSFGTKKATSLTHQTTMKPGTKTYTSGDWKVENNEVFMKQCVQIGCNPDTCVLLSHEGWVKYPDVPHG